MSTPLYLGTGVGAPSGPNNAAATPAPAADADSALNTSTTNEVDALLASLSPQGSVTAQKPMSLSSTAATTAAASAFSSASAIATAPAPAPAKSGALDCDAEDTAYTLLTASSASADASSEIGRAHV